jgi:TPR repeat protein
MNIFSIMVFFACLLCSINASGADIEREVHRAQKLLASGDYEKSFKEYSRVAKEKKNPLAQFTLALFYENGWGHPVDALTACQWYEKSARSGQLPVAVDSAARCTADGVHREADFVQAMAWYQQAADMGYSPSLCHLGDLYIAGKGVNSDPLRGAELCEQAAEQGSLLSMLYLGEAYLNQEALLDPGKALFWYAQAANSGSVVAQFQLGVMYRDGIATNRNPVTARQWFETSASRGYVPAYFETGNLYFNAPANPETGLWHPGDLASAYMWLSASSTQSEDETQRELAQGMLARLRPVMPETWAPELDTRVAEHIASHTAVVTED